MTPPKRAEANKKRNLHQNHFGGTITTVQHSRQRTTEVRMVESHRDQVGSCLKESNYSAAKLIRNDNTHAGKPDDPKTKQGRRIYNATCIIKNSRQEKQKRES